MLFIVRRCALLFLMLTGICLTSAAEQAPKMLRVPVVGLRYQVAKVHFEPLPERVLDACPSLAPDENMRGVFWVYAAAQEGEDVYYVIGGYGVRSRPEPPQYPRYELQDLGTVVHVSSRGCNLQGEALEVFQTRYFEEIPQPVLQRLADDLASRLAVSFGGKHRLAEELRRQQSHVKEISPELNKAFLSLITH